MEKKVAEPWDLLRGRDVFRDRVELHADLNSDLQHWAPNCCTFSRARERPIPGVENPPVPLRSSIFPRGIPEVVSNLPNPKKRKLSLDTDMADMAAQSCSEANRCGKLFTLEHPKNSIARDLESWQELEREEGVMTTEYHACMFEGCKRRKSQILIHNIPGIHPHLNLICKSSRICSRTGLPHLPWKPRVHKGRVTSFATGLEREYPPGFCKAYATAIQSLGTGKVNSFVEVFSGPNAPLSCAMASMWEIAPPAPPGFTGEPGPERSELSTARSTQAAPTTLPSREQVSVNTVPETSPYRVQSVQAAKQPSFGKRVQLIPNGLVDPCLHFEAAKQLEHPFLATNALKQDHLDSLEFLRQSSQEVIRQRLRILAQLKSLRNELEFQQ